MQGCAKEIPSAARQSDLPMHSQISQFWKVLAQFSELSAIYFAQPCVQGINPVFSWPERCGKARNLRREVNLFPVLVHGMLLPLVEEPLNRAHLLPPLQHHLDPHASWCPHLGSCPLFLASITPIYHRIVGERACAGECNWSH